MYSIDKVFLEPYDLLFYYSPSVPFDFPAEKLPKNVCEKELLLTYKCFRSFPKQSDDVGKGKYCHEYTSAFNQCKRRRDMQIFHEIKQWETEKYGTLPEELRLVYLGGLQQELNELREQFENTAAVEGNSSKRWRIHSDILQTKWRISYLTS